MLPLDRVCDVPVVHQPPGAEAGPRLSAACNKPLIVTCDIQACLCLRLSPAYCLCIAQDNKATNHTGGGDSLALKPVCLAPGDELTLEGQRVPRISSSLLSVTIRSRPEGERDTTLAGVSLNMAAPCYEEGCHGVNEQRPSFTPRTDPSWETRL